MGGAKNILQHFRHFLMKRYPKFITEKDCHNDVLSNKFSLNWYLPWSTCDVSVWSCKLFTMLNNPGTTVWGKTGCFLRQ